MMQRVADRFGDRRLARDARELLLEPRFEFEHEGLALLLAHRAARVGAVPADRLLDRIERRDALQSFTGDRGGAVLGDVKEPASQVCPTESERDHLAAGGVVGNVLVGGIAVALHDAAIVFEQLQGVDRAATGSVAVGDGGRVGSAPGSVITGDRPEVSLLGAATAGIEHRRHGLIDRDLARGQYELAHPKINRHQLGGRIADPERQDRALDVEALGEQHLSLTIERQMPGVFGDQHGGDHRLGRQPALDQPFGRARLHHRLLTGAARIFGTVRHDHPELRRDHVEPLRGLFADHMHRRLATGAVRVVGLDRYVDARQMGGKCAAVGAALGGPRLGSRCILLVLAGLVPGNGLLDIFERQKQLLGIELLRTPAKLRALQLMQQMPQAINLRQRLVALGEGGITLRMRRREQRMQRFDIGRKLIYGLAHARH